MNSDGHTKGTIDRQALLDAMNGKFTYAHATKLFPEKFSVSYLSCVLRCVDGYVAAPPH